MNNNITRNRQSRCSPQDASISLSEELALELHTKTVCSLHIQALFLFQFLFLGVLCYLGKQFRDNPICSSFICIMLQRFFFIFTSLACMYSFYMFASCECDFSNTLISIECRMDSNKNQYQITWRSFKKFMNCFFSIYLILMATALNAVYIAYMLNLFEL